MVWGQFQLDLALVLHAGVRVRWLGYAAVWAVIHVHLLTVDGEVNVSGKFTPVNTCDILTAMRRANKIDANQNAIVAALRKAKATVRIISQGDGIPDLLVGYMGETILMELKDGDKVPSARKLTPAEQKFFDEWTGGLCVVVESVEDALKILEGIE